MPGLVQHFIYSLVELQCTQQDLIGYRVESAGLGVTDAERAGVPAYPVPRHVAERGVTRVPDELVAGSVIVQLCEPSLTVTVPVGVPAPVTLTLTA